MKITSIFVISFISIILMIIHLGVIAEKELLIYIILFGIIVNYITLALIVTSK